jgi:hypothetical protein
MNRCDLGAKAVSIANGLAKSKGFVSMIDVLLLMEKLSKQNYEAWRLGRVRCLESVVSGNLKQLEFLLRLVRKFCLSQNMRESWTAYHSWGKQRSTPLRFTKSGNPHLEKLYATHYLVARE